ncbi:hypothetical protein AC622_01270 [Bacillus sp. FJAT-27916]|uniref:carbon storage regulator CsrA n=1 Tax=Bacillaceae TaxID=186817 RepID=UPI0006716B52|nr:carbon storage regulator CsrA [Bacillus sp. FJAT-27916]KMY43054.1 hypothetical protein AC622_01270 [Bacillus sp. FJAT-27916]
MLILSRKKDESILIGSDIEVTVIAVQGDQVKLGIKAPKKVDVYRKELFEEIQNENVEAAEITINMSELLKNTKL